MVGAVFCHLSCEACSICRILPLKKAAVEKVQAARAAAASSFKAMLQEKGDITPNSRWSKVCLL